MRDYKIKLWTVWLSFGNRRAGLWIIISVGHTCITYFLHKLAFISNFLALPSFSVIKLKHEGNKLNWINYGRGLLSRTKRTEHNKMNTEEKYFIFMKTKVLLTFGLQWRCQAILVLFLQNLPLPNERRKRTWVYCDETK